MALTPPDQLLAYSAFVSADTFSTLTKPDIRAAVVAVDAWADANAASFNAALPQPARGVLTVRQKARLLMAVIQRRYEVS